MPAWISLPPSDRSIYAVVLLLTCSFLFTLASSGRITIVNAVGSPTAVSLEDEIPPRPGAFDAETNMSDRSPGRPECTSVATVRWLPRSTVNISYARGEFTEDQRAEFHRAVSLWQRALSEMRLGIVLEEHGEIDKDTRPAPSQIIVKRDQSMDSSHYGKIVASARPDNYLDRAFILISGSLRKRSSLRKTMLHELGHAFGLRDCLNCRSGATVMNYFSEQSFMGLKILKVGKNISDKPTACDISEVASGYRQSRAPVTKNEEEEWKTRTLVADGTVALPATNSADTDDNIIAPYLRPKAAIEVLAIDSRPEATPATEVNMVSIGPRDRPMLTEAEKIEFESYIPTLLGKEAETMSELNNYTFTRVVRIQTIDSKGRVAGEYRRTSDMLFDDSGRRIERSLSFSKSTLRRLNISPEYVADFSGAQLKGFELSKRDHYRIEPFMADKIHGISMRVYRMTPLNLDAEKAAQTRVFYGYVWVEETTGKIVRIGGCALPEGKQRYPLFETQRALIDGVHFFPVHTIADDYLVFSSHTVHVRMVITYTNYKRFDSRVKIIEVDS